MRPLLSILLAPALLAAEDKGNSTAETSPDRQLPAVSLMPAGSVLTKVMIPRYDLQRKLTAVLRAEKLTVINEQAVAGDDVSVELYKPDRTQSGRIDLKEATFDQRRGVLESKEAVEIVSTDFAAQGTGLTYAYQQGQGFLLGPVQTRFFPKPKPTSMNFPSTLRTTATALVTTLLTMPAFAGVPPRLSPEEQTALETSAASTAGYQKNEATAIKGQIAEGEQISGKASEALAAFLKQAALASIAVDGDVDASPAGQPLVVKENPNTTVISSENGMYFDSEKGLLVYLKNVKLTDPRFTMTGANELKVILEKKEPAKKPATPAPADAKDKPADAKDKPSPSLIGATDGFGDVERIIATGAIKVVQKPVAGKPGITASAAILTYNVKTGEMILKGGYPWVTQGDNYARATTPDAYLRIKDGSFVTDESPWDVGLPIPDNTKKPAR